MKRGTTGAPQHRGGGAAGAARFTGPPLYAYQRAWVEDASSFLAGCWSRQTGKDFATSRIVAQDMLLRPGIQWMIAAPSERQRLESLAAGAEDPACAGQNSECRSSMKKGK